MNDKSLSETNAFVFGSSALVTSDETEMLR